MIEYDQRQLPLQKLIDILTAAENELSIVSPLNACWPELTAWIILLMFCDTVHCLLTVNLEA